MSFLLKTDKITVEYTSEGTYNPPQAPPIIKEWIADLRANPEKQGIGKLHNIEEDTYCCLGRLCKLQGRLKDGKDGLQDTVLASDNPLHSFFGRTGYFEDNISVKVRGNERFELTSLNDTEGLSFLEIADIIEVIWPSV